MIFFKIIFIFLVLAVILIIVVMDYKHEEKNNGNLTNSTGAINTTLNKPAFNKSIPVINKTNNTSETIIVTKPKPKEPREKTCIEIGGEICSEGKECDEELFSVSDTEECCLGRCIIKEVERDYSELSEIELAIHTRVNENRVIEGIDSLEFDSGLADIARKHSQDMIDRNFFSHINPDGLDPFQRIAVAGISCRAMGENIALRSIYYGCGDGGAEGIADCIIEIWMNSEGHRTNILTSIYKKEGIGVAISSEGVAYATEAFCG